MQHTNWNQLTDQHPVTGVTTQRFDSNGMTIVRYTFAPGATFPLHAHVEEQVVIILTGDVTFTVADKQIAMRAGDICHVDPHVPHGAEAGPAGVEFLNLLSPRRIGSGDLVFMDRTGNNG